jgi:prophage regulatory protein
MTGLARSTIYERMACGGFPRQIHLGPRSVGWLASDVEDWLAARIAESRPAVTTEAKL